MDKIFSYSSCREVIESHLQVMAQQKDRKLTLDNIKIGEEFEPLEFTFTEEDRDMYAWANDDYNPWYMEDSPWGGCIGTATCLAMQTLMQVYGHYGVEQKGINPPGAVVHNKHEYEFINPLKIGKKLRMTGKPVEKYSRRGRDWIVTEHSVVDEDGKEIVRMRVRNAWPIVVQPEKGLAKDEYRTTTMHFEQDPTAFRPMKVTASKDIPVGFETEPFTKKWTLDKGRIFQPWPRNKTFHNDYPSAHNLNLRAPIAAGCQYLEYMGELVIKFFGKDYLGARLSASFLGFVYPEDELTIKGVVREKTAEGDTVRLTLDISALNQRGENIIAGTASGLVH